MSSVIGSQRGRIVTVALTMGLTSLGAWLASPDAANLAQLRSIPTEQRRVLSERLRQFDLLPRAERQALLDLDQRLAELPVEERERYLTILHRYHLWTQTLSAEQREALERSPTEERIGLAQQYRALGKTEREQQAAQVFFQSSVLSPIPLFESAFLLRTWFRLTPEEQDGVRKLKTLEQKWQQLKGLAGERKIYRDISPIRDEIDSLKRQFQAGAANKERITKYWEPQGKAIPIYRLVEARYFLTHEPEPIPREELIRFEAVLPSWFRETYSALSPELARRRLTILYRLVFGDDGIPPELVPQPAQAQPPGKSATPAPTPAGRGSGSGAAPF